MTTVVLADDQELVRSGLRALLQARGIAVVGDAEHGRTAIQATRTHLPDVLLMDIRMPVMDGITATREIIAAGLPTRILILTTYDLDEYVYQALRAGAAGFMLKASPPDRLVDAIHLIARGEALLAPTLTQRLIAEYVRRPPPGTESQTSSSSSPSGSAKYSCSSPADYPTTTSPPRSSLASPPSRHTSTASSPNSDSAAECRQS